MTGAHIAFLNFHQKGPIHKYQHIAIFFAHVYFTTAVFSIHLISQNIMPLIISFCLCFLLFWDRRENEVGLSLILLLLELLEETNQVSFKTHMVEVKPACNVLQLIKIYTVGDKLRFLPLFEKGWRLMDKVENPRHRCRQAESHGTA